MKLSEIIQGKDNNFNLIRIIAATAVLVTHSFALLTGASTEPLRDLIGMSLGDIAVDVFFITSGFLVGASLFKRGDLVDFWVSRALRIFPGLWAMLALTCFALAAYFSTLPLARYVTAPDLWIYLLKCGTLVTGVVFDLPGVFESNPYPKAVNGSLWSMPFEIWMYMGLASIWALTKYTIGDSARNIRYVIGAAFVGAAVLLTYKHHQGSTGKLAKLIFMFSTGAFYFVMRHRIHVNAKIFTGLVILLACAMSREAVFFYAYCAFAPYILFYLAYVPKGKIREYNRVGDYSYGLYIYAFPIQQSIAALAPRISILNMVLISAALTLPMAMLSWHVLEKRALGWRARVSQAIHERLRLKAA